MQFAVCVAMISVSIMQTVVSVTMTAVSVMHFEIILMLTAVSMEYIGKVVTRERVAALDEPLGMSANAFAVMHEIFLQDP
jgi:hypothetical protein